VVSLTSSSGGYINGRNSANLKFIVLGYNSTYFSNKIQKGKACYSEEQVISMLEFLIDNIFVSGYWPLHNESIARCKHHMQEKLVYCCTYLENF
jgi:hypothetical protein